MLNKEKISILIDEMIKEAQEEPQWKAESALRCLKKELLKEQEPRVMTLDEVKGLQSLHDGAVWLEVLSGLFPALPEICMPNITFFVAIPFDHYRGYFDNEYYGKTWRCWTARPTNEQRGAVKWND